jgi:Na+/H+ antiporter NhaD/arsenite permease-like protein
VREQINIITDFIKKDPILIISGMLAAVSCFIVPPDATYLSYINFRVLAILMSLMLVVAVLLRIGTFDFLTDRLLKKLKTSRSICLLLTTLSFFMAMFLTNDVTLVTLVPFSIAVLKSFDDRKTLMFTLILMTVAANLGSMLTPIGNPQNLYLYTNYQMELLPFIKLMLPYSAVSLILTALAVILLCKNKKSEYKNITEVPTPDAKKLVICVILFAVCVLAVADILNWIVMFAAVCAIIAIMDRKTFKYVDYMLLLTFIFFFVLIGNIGRIEAVYNALSKVVAVSPVLTAVAASQIISNVPAAMLLSAFTDNGEALVVGTNLGGLGTLIASMASLITYKFYAATPRDKKNTGMGYLPAFTVVNVVFLALLLLLWAVLR